MGHAAQAESRGIEGVHLRHAHLRQVRCRAHAVLGRLVQQRRHDRRRMRAELQPLDSFAGGVAHPLAGVLGGQDLALLPLLAAAGALIGDDARRHDLVGGATVALGEVPLERPGGNPAHRGDAVPEPQLVDVLGFRRLGHAAGVHVEIDDAGHRVPPLGVDLMGGVGRPLLLVEPESGSADGLDLGDAVSFDDDVDRPDRRRARAVDERHAADDEALEGTGSLALSPRRGGKDRLVLLRLLASLPWAPRPARRSGLRQVPPTAWSRARSLPERRSTGSGAPEPSDRRMSA